MLHPVRQPAQAFGVADASAGCACSNLRTGHRLAKHASEYALHPGPIGSVEAPQRAVVWRMGARQPPVPQLLLSDHFHLLARSHTGHEAEDPHIQQRLRALSRFT